MTVTFVLKPIWHDCCFCVLPVLRLHVYLISPGCLPGTLGRSGEALTKMWAQFTSGRGAGAGAGVGTGAGGRGGEVEMRGLMKPIDEDLED